MSKAFVLLSGGIDSAVCLEQALKNFSDVEAVHFDYGQQTENIERRNAEAQCREDDIPLHVVDYRDVFRNFAEGTIRDKEYDSENLSREGHSVGYVPQRNLHLLTSAGALAEYHTDEEEIILYIGAQANDSEDYPDCRPKFLSSAEKALNKGTDQHNFEIRAPLIELSKPEVLRKGEEMGVDWEKTFSCYNDDNGKPCGECPACIERKEAFDQVDFEDHVGNIES